MADKLFTKSKFQINGLLPPGLIIKGADSHLYRIGLSLFESKTNVKRKWYRSPIMLASIMYIYLIKHLILLFVDLGSDDNLWLIGDVDYYMKTIILFKYAWPICCSLILGSHFINVYNKWKGIKLDLNVFEMLAGFTTPASIGLKDKEMIIKLIKFSRRALMIVEMAKMATVFNTFVIWFLLPYMVPSPFGIITDNKNHHNFQYICNITDITKYKAVPVWAYSHNCTSNIMGILQCNLGRILLSNSVLSFRVLHNSVLLFALKVKSN